MKKKWYKKWWGILLLLLFPWLLFIVIWQSELTKKRKLFLHLVLECSYFPFLFHHY